MLQPFQSPSLNHCRYLQIDKFKRDDQKKNSLLDNAKTMTAETMTAEKVHSLLKQRLPLSSAHLTKISTALSSKINELNLVSSRDFKPFELHLEILKDETEIHCIFSNALMGQGCVKAVSEGHLVAAMLPPENALNRKYLKKFKQQELIATHSPIVIFEPLDPEAVKHIERGIALQEKLQKLLSKSHFPEAIKRLDGVDPQFYQKRYSTNLQKLLDNNFFDKSYKDGKRSLNLTKILEIFIQAANFLKECHALQYVHGNIKPSNILVEIHQDEAKNDIYAYVTDYDLMQLAGPGSVPKTKFFDRLSDQNFITPFTDVFGLTSSLKDAVQAVDRNQQSKRVKKAVQELNKLIEEVSRIELKLLQNFTIEQDGKWLSINQNFKASQKLKPQNYEENKDSAIKFMNQMNKLSTDDQWKHPLYIALEEPMQMDTSEKIKYSIHTEVNLITVHEESELYLEMKNQLKGIKDKDEQYDALKRYLESIIKNKKNPSIENEAKQVQEQIETIENAMEFAINLRDQYRENTVQIMKMAMSMDEFLNRLKEINKTLNSE